MTPHRSSVLAMQPKRKGCLQLKAAFRDCPVAGDFHLRPLGSAMVYRMILTTTGPLGVIRVFEDSVVRNKPKSDNGTLVLFLSVSMVATFGFPVFGVEPSRIKLPSEPTAHRVRNAPLGTPESSWNFALTRVAPLLLKLGVMKMVERPA